MNRKTYVLELNRSSAHNTILLTPKSEIKVVFVKTVSVAGDEVIILSTPETLDSPTSIRYDSTVSSRVWIEIEGTYVNELTLDDLLDIDISLANYSAFGEYVSEKGRVSFHKYISVAYDINNIKDVFVQAELGIEVLDKYNAIVYSESIPISLNDDYKMVSMATNGNTIKLDVEPSEVEVIVEGDYIDEFTVDGKFVTVDIPKDTNCYAVYKPFYIGEGSFKNLSENVSINSNNEIRLRDDNCEYILYTIKLKFYNTDVTSINHTPVLKSLALIATSK